MDTVTDAPTGEVISEILKAPKVKKPKAAKKPKPTVKKAAKPKAKKAKKAKKPAAKKKPAKKAKAKRPKVMAAIARSERLDMRLTKAEKAKVHARAKKLRRTVTSIVIEAIEKIK